MPDTLSIILKLLATIGGVVVIGVPTFFLLWWKSPDNLEKMVFQVTRLVRFFGIGGKKVYVKYRIQSALNKPIKDFEAEFKGSAPYGLEVQWIDESASRESFLQGNTIIAKMNYDQNPNKNILNALLIYVQKGFAPTSRTYLHSDLCRATDLFAVGMILERLGNPGVRQTFYDDILPKELQSNETLANYHEVMNDIEEYGYFSKVFLPELVSFNGNAGGVPPRARHKQELQNFLDHLGKIAEAAANRQLATLDFSGHVIKASIIVVGIREKLRRQGATPYLRALRHANDHGADTVYFVGMGASAAAVPIISRIAEKNGLCSILAKNTFKFRNLGDSEDIPAVLYRVSVVRTEEAEAIEGIQRLSDL